MSQKRIQSTRYLAFAAVASVIATTAPVANASATWIPDLVFPETVPVPTAKPARTAPGSNPRGKNTLRVRQSHRDTAATEKLKVVPHGHVASQKEAQR